uniref:C-type lectin domain-containing protein n=1 Tax=Fundulus heteroclitus TaxID=8078 RepID=A0A3Q2QMD5_FUNHE
LSCSLVCTGLRVYKAAVLSWVGMTLIILALSSFSGTAATFTVGPSPMTWAAAQSYCRTHHTDLASVRNDNENEQLKATKPDKETVWLGLFRDNWKWSNGSQVTYTYWGSAEPSGPTEYCAAANFASLGHWVDLECAETLNTNREILPFVRKDKEKEQR